MKFRLACQLVWRRYRWPGLFSITALLALPTLALTGLTAPGPAIVAASDDGSQRSQAHYLAFRALLIPRSELEARQNAVIDLALQHGLKPGRIEFGVERDDAGGFERATLALPLRGDYVDLQKFLGAALFAEPALGVAELVLQRDVTARGVDARLRLVFLLQATENGRP
ncbi:hypothetical protein [Sulfuricystis multivorans]|uniref:hypothetical protein n=1 Tax=Sulfuricystis multivorans TaxID=2211108 RepID=UPI000F848C70|nr:hypothetical protein [Sulfuricystis multivorans]